MSYLKPVKYHNFSFSTSTGRRALLKKNLSKRLVCSSVWSNTLAATGFIQVCAWSSWDALLSHHQSKEGFQFFYLPHRTERMDQQHSGPLFYYTVHTGRVAHWSRNKEFLKKIVWTNNPKGSKGSRRGGSKWPAGQENVCHFSHGHAMVTKFLTLSINMSTRG